MAELPPVPGQPGSPPPGSPPPGPPPPLGGTPPPGSMPPGAPPPAGELPVPGALPPPAGFQGPAPGLVPAAAPPAGGGGVSLNYGGMYSMKRNSEAVGSLTAALVGLVMFCLVIPPIVGGIAAILLGLKAKRTIAASNGAESGDGMATAGLVIGIVDLAVVAIFVLTVLGSILRAFHG